MSLNPQRFSKEAYKGLSRRISSLVFVCLCVYGIILCNNPLLGSCVSRVRPLQIRVDENGKIIDAKFKTFGCGSAIASSSLATEWVKGKSVSLLALYHIAVSSVGSVLGGGGGGGGGGRGR